MYDFILQEKIPFFGVILSHKGIQPDSNKLNFLENASPPKDVTYSSRFIEIFSEKTAILRQLLKENRKYIWTDTHQKCFENSKYELCGKHLAFYDPDKTLELHTDASNYAVGAVLIQYDENKEKQLIVFISRALNDREIRYSVTEKEAPALVWAVDKLHICLYGKHFHAFVDHKPVKHIFKPRSKLNAKLFRWQLHLQNYNFTVYYQKGAGNTADFLSRIRHEEGSNNVHYKNLTIEHCNFILSQAIPKTLSLAEIQEHTKLDNTLNLVVEALKSNKWESDEVQRYK